MSNIKRIGNIPERVFTFMLALKESSHEEYLWPIENFPSKTLSFLQHVMSNLFLLNSKLEATRSFYQAYKAARFLLQSVFLNKRRLLFCACSSSSPNEAAATLKKVSNKWHH
jgi:hypothetical protein